MSRFRKFDAGRAYEMVPGVTRNMLTEGGHAMAVRLECRAGSTVPLHSHPHEQIGFLLSGRASLRIGDDVRELLPGDSYAIPPNVEHAVPAVAEDSVFVDIFSPPRDEYRQ